jgi:hypothetical protein
MREHALDLPGGGRLSFEDKGNGVGLELHMGRQVVARCLLPVAAQLFVQEGHRREWHRAGYVGLEQTANGILALGELSLSSSRVSFHDTYVLRGDHLRIARRVDVHNDSPGHGFLSALEWDLQGATADDSWFAPGVWHGRNDHVPPYAIGSPRSRRMQENIVFREDRLTLPFLLHYGKARISFSLSHLAADGRTVAADDEDAPLIDERLSFASLGMSHSGRTISFWFPGTEGETSYPPMWTLGRGNNQADSPVNPFKDRRATSSARIWSLRFHPLRDAFRHEYLVRLDCERIPRFFSACDTQWRRISDEYRPREESVALDRVERASVDLLAGMTVRTGDAIGIPTWIDCFSGGTGRLQNTFGIGFVSRNLEAASLLLRYGRRMGNSDMVSRGTEILDFWTARSGFGLSHTEYNPATRAWTDAEEEGAPCVYLRDQSESRRACLQAWQHEQEHGVSHLAWLQWAKSFGDWLMSREETDTELCRAYRLDGTPVSTALSDCSHVVPFLLALDRTAGATTYTRLAQKKARLMWEKLHRSRTFIGGTLDNPNCTDKEGAALAFEAYLALFEATGARRWLLAAEEAARVCETWIFEWNVPMPTDSPERFFPPGRTTVGFQLITTGFSAFDVYLTRHVGEFARLARYTGDGHYLEIAKILLHNTKSTIQLDSEYGYARPGMQIEHWSMGRGRGFGLNSGWLPWVSTSHLISIDSARTELLAQDL